MSFIKKIILFSFMPFTIFAVDYDWAGLNQAQWGIATNWTPNGVPAGFSDTITLPQRGAGEDYAIYGGSTDRAIGLITSNSPGRTTFYNPGATLTIDTGIIFNANATGGGFASLYPLAFSSGATVDMSAANSSSTYCDFYGFGAGAFDTTFTVVGPGMFSIEDTLFDLTTLNLSGGVTFENLGGFSTATGTATNVVMSDSSIYHLNRGNRQTIPTNFTGDGAVWISSGVRTFTGTNTFTGGLSLRTGSTTVIGTTSNIPSSGGVSLMNPSATIQLNQSFSGTYSGVISGSGQFVKAGSGNVTLSNTNTYTGATTVSAGTLTVTGVIAADSTTTVASGATLAGTGTLGPVVNNGSVQAGASAGDTLTITGTYTQASDATLNVFLNTSSASSLNISGAATLDGTLNLNIAAGTYSTDTTFTVLTAGSVLPVDGELLGSTFSALTENHSGDWAISYTSTTVTVQLQSSIIVTPVALSALKGNSKSIGDYFFGSPTFTAGNADLTAVSSAMTSLNASDFTESLIEVSPLAYASIPFASFQNDVEMAVILDKQFHKKVVLEDDPCYGIPKTGLFIEPVAVFQRQKQSEGTLTNLGQVPYDSYTYGAGTGWQQVFGDHFILEGGVGYTHSNLLWRENFGNARWSTIYVAPFFGWFNDHAFGNFMVMGAFNFHRTHRRIDFPGVSRIARSQYHSYDLLLRGNGGARLLMGEGFWFQPEGTLNYLTIFTEKYTETDAKSLSLQVKRNTNYIMQPSIRARLIKQWTTKNFCYAPNIYVGWLANIVLKKQSIEARFDQAPNQTFFNIEGYTKTINQLILGAEFYAQKFDQFIITSTFEIDMLSKLKVYLVNAKFEWEF